MAIALLAARLSATDQAGGSSTTGGRTTYTARVVYRRPLGEVRIADLDEQLQVWEAATRYGLDYLRWRDGEGDYQRRRRTYRRKS
jgi:hypothetical protein